MEVVGKKGINYLRFLGVPVAEKITDVEDRIAFERVSDMAERYMRPVPRRARSRASTWCTCSSTASACSARRWPSCCRSKRRRPRREATASAIEFEFSPPAEQLLTRLIPEAVKIRLFQCFNDAIVSEQVARAWWR